MRKVQKMYVIFFIFILFFLSIFVVDSKDLNSSKFENTSFYDIIIPDDYSTIQKAINNANPGDIIFVRSNIYFENLLINTKDLTLIGQNKENTIIDGNIRLKDHAINIQSDNCTVKNFTIQNGWFRNEMYWDLSGIRINGSNSKIISNIIKDNRLGICTMSKTYNHSIKDNIFLNDGILFANYVYNFHMTIDDFIHDIKNNTVNSKPLYYFINKNNFTVPEDAGQIYLVNCTNITIENQNLNNTDFSIILAGCNNCIVKDNLIKNTDGELILFLSENNTIEHNIISNSLHGICLDYNSKNNIVRYNDVSKSWIGISTITGSENNKIYQNNVYDNKAGIEITTYYVGLKSFNHKVYDNQIYDCNKGIIISLKSENLSFYDNIIYRNNIGISIKESENNNFSKNVFMKNIISTFFSDCSKNFWKNNYWDRSRFFPKIIFGYKKLNNFPVLCINIDKNPL